MGTPEAQTTSTVWHSTLNLPLSITEPQRQTTFTYTATGQLLTRSVSAGGISRTTTYTYHSTGTNGAGKVATIDGSRTDVNDLTTYAYNASDDLISITNALGHTTQITSHDASGRPLTTVDANNITTTLSWDLRGRLLSITKAGSTTSFTYDAVGQVTRTTSADGSYIEYQYDDAHRLIGMNDNANNTITYILDNMGNRTSSTVKDSGGNISTSQTALFDKLSQLQQSLGADAQQQSYTYDANHNALSSTDALSHQTQSNFDALDRLIKSIDPDAKETNFEYDTQDNLSKVIDAKGLETSYAHNGFAEVISQTSPDTGTTTYIYDSAGNRTSMSDARGVTTTYSYDALNRLTAIAYADTTLNITHSYDTGSNGVGRLTQTIDASGTTTYSYDARGNLLSQTRSSSNNAGSHTISYSYNAADRLSGMTYPSGNSLQIQRAANGEINQITATIDGVTQTILSNASYRPFGAPQSFTYGNGLNYTATFDQSSRLTGQSITSIQGNTYGYNTVDNIITFDNSLDSALNQQFSYDVNDRLTDADGAYGDFGYVFDVVGNRTQKTENTNTDTYSYASSSHHLQSITGSNTSSYQYDAVGNTTDNGTYQFIYGEDNRLHQVMQGLTQIAAYTYNAQGQRTQKITPAKTTYYHYNQTGNLIAETDDQSNALNETYWFNGSPYALYTSAGASSSNTSNTLLSQSNLSGNATDYLHYNVVVPSGVTSLNINLTNVTGDPELFVKHGSQASNSAYDCNSENGNGNDETCIISNPQAGTWHIAVYGYDSFSGVTLTAKTITGSAPTAGIPYITTPTTILAGSTQTFSWNGNGASDVNYWLEIGSSLGTSNYYGQELGTSTSQTVTGLPTDGSPVFVRLYYNNNWDAIDVEYTASSTPISGVATITTPPNGATLTGATQIFSWDSNGASNINYWLEIGSTLGGNDYYGEDLNTATSQTVTGLPTDGSTVYVRLYYNNNWDYEDFSYTASNTSNAEVYYIHNNHLGTPETITDQNQSIVWKAEYTPYGKATLATETITNNIRLPGQYYDAETELHYNYFRYYDATMGRYGNVDPINNTDPSGNFSLGSVGATLNTIGTLANIASISYEVFQFASGDKEMSAKEIGSAVILKLILRGGDKKASALLKSFKGLLSKKNRRRIESCFDNSFVAGTLISTSSGLKAIEDISIGDMVLSYNESTGETEFKEVIHLIGKFKFDNYVTFQIGTGEEITSTGEHEFYINNSWTDALDIKLNQEFMSINDSVQIQSINKSKSKHYAYNFTVDSNHNYYVSKSEILAHNAKPGCPIFQKPKTVRSPSGVSGIFTIKGYKYRIDSNRIHSNEKFHVHIYKGTKEIAKITAVAFTL